MTWSGEIALYDHQRRTRPVQMCTGLSWGDLMNLVAPEGGPMLREDKIELTYFTPGVLREDVPLTGKTLARARARGEPEVGAMRSAAHATTTTFITFEFDGLTQSEFTTIGQRVLGKGRAGLAYTTHSFGRADKPGIRVRLILPVDLRLDAKTYRDAHETLNTRVFMGMADRTGKSMCQQQAVFGAAPSRVALAKCWRLDGEVFKLKEFLQQHGGTEPAQAPGGARQPGTQKAASPAKVPTLARLEQATPYLRATTYASWTTGLTAFKALAGCLDRERLRELAVQFGETSPSDSTRAQLAASDLRYDPGHVFDSAAPTMPPETAAGVLLGMARSEALALVESSRGQRTASNEVREAAAYLAAHHRAAWDALVGSKRGKRSEDGGA